MLRSPRCLRGPTRRSTMHAREAGARGVSLVRPRPRQSGWLPHRSTMNDAGLM